MYKELFIKRRTPFVTRRSGYKWGSPIYTVGKCLFFIPTQKIKQFRGMYRFIVRKLGKEFGKLLVIFLDFMSIGLIVPHKFG